MRLQSQVCSTQVIVVRPGRGSVLLTCGGLPLVDLATPYPEGGTPAPGLDTGSVMGKRYTAQSDETFEVLVTKPGAGSLGDADTPLIVKQAAQLPASD